MALPTDDRDSDGDELRRLVLDAAEIGCWQWDPPLGRITGDARWRALFGLAPDVAPAPAELAAWIDAEDRERIAAEAARALAAPGPFRSALRITGCDGAPRWIEVWGRSIAAGGGEAPRLRGVAIDVTGRVEESFRSVFAGVAIGIVYRTPGGHFVEANPAYCALTGYPVDELRALPLERLLHPDDAAGYQRQLARVRAGDLASFIHEVRYVRRHGEVVWVRMSTSLMRDSQGAPQWILALVEDISDRKRAEEALRESEAKFRTLANNISHFAWMADAAGRPIWYNQRWYEFAGVDPGDPRVPEWLDYFDPAHLDRVRAGLARAVAAGVAWGDTFPMRGADGRTRWFLGHAIPVRDRDGQVAGWLGTGTDVTELRAIQEELREAKAAADAANRAKSEFLANMSHELRTPMNAILGMTDLALREPLSPTLRDQLQTVKDSGELLLGLLNQLLDFSRIEAGQMELERAPFRLRQAIMRVARALALRASERDLELIVDVADEVPDAVVGDPLRLRQILFNLVGNAIKFTHAGEVVIAARTRAQGDGDGDGDVTVELAVTDTGVGISAEDQARIFAPFVQAHAATARRHGGTGLGLAIVRGLVEGMGGEVQVESELGRGSTFTVTVRLGRQAAAGGAEDGATEAGLDALRGLQALIVAHNPGQRRALQRAVSAWGMRVVATADAATALATLHDAAADARPFAVVLCEAALPGFDGFSLARWVKRDRALAGGVVLLLAADERGDHKERCRALGAHPIDKPVSPSDLLGAITRALGLERADADAPRDPGRCPASRSLRVLLAEDTPANQKLVTYLLRARGHAIEAVGDGLQAVERLRRAPYDVVLMDVQMPVLDGVEATRAIRSLDDPARAGVPIIALTAHAIRGDAERYLAAGMNAYLSKPIAGDALIELVERIAAAAAPAAPPPAFDPAQALRTCFGDRAMFEAMIECLFEEAEPRLGELRAALAAGDVEAMHRAAHRLKNTLVYLGAGPAEAAADRLIAAALAGDLAPAPALVDRLAGALAALQGALREHRR